MIFKDNHHFYIICCNIYNAEDILILILRLLPKVTPPNHQDWFHYSRVSSGDV